MKKYYPIELDKGEFQLGAEKTSPEINTTSNPVGLVLAGGGVTVKCLEVTENGTYTAPTGEAYSPVVVSVAGGGSSDFSTAEVEFKNQTTTILKISCCCIVDDNIESIPPLNAAKNKTFTAVLYKGSQQVEIPFGVELTTVTGDITLDSEEGIITINGSGTVLFQP